MSALAFVILVLMLLKEYSDVEWYYKYAEALVSGKMPYEVYDNVAYPPMFLYISAIPALITDSLDVYSFLYLVMSAAMVVFMAKCSLKMCDEYGVSHWYVYLTFLLLMAFAPVHAIDRNDGMATIIAMLGMYMFMKKRDSLCFLLIAVSIMIKIYPGIILVAFLIPFVINRDWKKGILYLVLTGIVCILIQLPCYTASPESCFNYLTQNSGRPLEIEACVGLIVMVFMTIFPNEVWVEHADDALIDPTLYTYGSDNFRGAFPDALAGIMMPLMAIALLCVIVYFIRKLKGRSMDRDFSLAAASLMGYIMVLIFMLFNKVYSSQYGVWPIMLFTPVIILLNHYGLNIRRLTERYIIFGLATLVATILFSGDLGVPFFLATLFKTVALIVLLVECFRTFNVLIGTDMGKGKTEATES